ncbi:MAG: Ig-like domain-containing protein [Bacteroidetes bacterium]|nr:Ig-like domain-containing protein [Bacteroidota bacterium]
MQIKKRCNRVKQRYLNISEYKSAHLLICILLFSCAQIVNPGGGAVDRTPPKALKYLPDSAALNFRSKQVRILFNEYIQLKDVNNQLIISPPLRHQPEVKVKNKELVVDIEDTLAANTTYAFNFGSSIADITEGNAIDNFQYVFSTGPFIDSLMLSGTVKDAFTLGPEKGVLVMIYNTFEDSVPLKKLPNHFAKTKEDGSFRINNIRAGKYKVFALKDANANYLYDSQEESIAFLDTLVDMKKNVSVNLFLFKEVPKRQFIKRAAAIEFGHIQIIFNKPVLDLQLTPVNFVPKNSDWKIEEFSKTKDTLDLWLPDFERDSIRLIVSDDKKVLDTLEIAIPPKVNKGKGNKFQLTYTTNLGSNLFDLNKSVILTFNHPLKGAIDQSIVALSEDSVKQSSVFLLGGYNSRKIELKLSYMSPWKENSEYKILILPGKITDLFGLKNDSILIKFKTQELKNYGTIKLSIGLGHSIKKYILNMINDKGNLIDKYTLSGDSSEVYFRYLTPGNYRLKLIYNTIENDGWDTGNYLYHQQPEKVIYSSPITIRSNWDLEQVWEIKE